MALIALEPPMSPFPFPDENEDGAQSARLANAPDVAEYTTDARTSRARMKPKKYKQDESPTEKRFAGFSKARRQELNEQFKINQATRKIIRNNTAMIRSQALNHACPLLMKRAIERGDFDQNSTSSLLRVQIKRMAIAPQSRLGFCPTDQIIPKMTRQVEFSTLDDFVESFELHTRFVRHIQFSH